MQLNSDEVNKQQKLSYFSAILMRLLGCLT
jgi:hypothetical protein